MCLIYKSTSKLFVSKSLFLGLTKELFHIFIHTHTHTHTHTHIYIYIYIYIYILSFGFYFVYFYSIIFYLLGNIKIFQELN